MSANRQQFEDRLRILRADYAATLPRKLTHLADLWRDAFERGEAGALAAFIQQCHALAGSGSTFGFPAITERGRQLEQLLRPLAEAGSPLDAAVDAQVTALLEDLARASEDGGAAESGAEGARSTPPSIPSSVDLLGDDGPLHDELHAQLAQFQYRVTRFIAPEALLEAIGRRAPAVVVLDRDLPQVAQAFDSLVEAIHAHSFGQSQILVLGSEDSFALRLEAARANVQAWVRKPPDMARMVDTIDRLATPAPSEPYRVMIVDDDADTRSFIRFVLEQRGMRVFTVSRVDELLDNMREFGPELVLTDLYMPSCTGLELARVIRQHDEYLGIPIVYLSSETDIHKQVMALSEGADDFLTKPIAPHKLVSRIASRIQRYRGLSTLLAHDGLTGLLNHTTFKERLQHEALRADRQDSFFSYVMLDIDDFKQVNDTRGHATGDRVIRNLARLLTRRLRRSDLIGRYGGEEFAVVLPDTAIEDALRLLDSLREDFAALRHRDDSGDEFHVSFSAGVAQYPDFDDIRQVHAAADAALYRAKQEGRNRVLARRSTDSV